MIETERIIFRPIELGDSQAIFAYSSDSETNKYQNWIPKHFEDVYEFITKNPDAFDMPNTWYQLVIMSKEFDILIGDVGIHFIDEYQCEIGCTLSIEKVYRYIQNQEVHHKNKTFKEEYLEFLQQHEIDSTINNYSTGWNKSF
jgi:RimJ/RimL family protein N-acetyltransferase